MKHINAGDVLPERLLKAIQRYCSGYIWVPSDGQFYAKRRQDVARLRGRGLGARAIAERAHICERRVRQILAEATESGKKYPVKSSAGKP